MCQRLFCQQRLELLVELDQIVIEDNSVHTIRMFTNNK